MLSKILTIQIFQLPPSIEATVYMASRLVVARRPFWEVFFFFGGYECEEAEELIGVDMVFLDEKST